MSEQITLEVQRRSERGTNANRRLRRTLDLIPGVLYGKQGDTESIMISNADLNKALQEESVFSQVLNVKFGKDQIPAVLRDLQRHPASNKVLHLDLLRISEDEEIQVSVPLHFMNEDTCVGVKQGGGNIARSLTELDVRCLPKDLPGYIEVDLEQLEAGQTIHLSELVLPKGVTPAYANLGEHEYDLPVVTVSLRRGGMDLDEEEDALEAEEMEEESTETEEDAD